YETLRKIEELEIQNAYVQEIKEGYNTKQPMNSHGLAYIHQFYTKRAFLVLNEFVNRVRKENPRALWFATAVSEGSSLLNLERPFGLPSKLSGTLYVSSMIREINVIEFLKRKVAKFVTAGLRDNSLVSTQSTTDLKIKD